MNAEQHLGQSEHGLRVVAANAIAAGKGELEAAAEAGAVDRGDAGEGRALEPLEQRVRLANRAHDLVRRADAAELVDVGADDETAGLARGEHQPARAGLLDLQHALGEFEHHLAGQGIGARALPVDAQPRDAIGVGRQGPVTQAAALLAPVTRKSQTSGRWSE